jgi:hypothetical protein
MSAEDENLDKLRIALFVPPELQRRGFQNRQIFSDLAACAFEPLPRGLKQIQPWCRWQGLSQYLDCVAFADRSAKEIPTDSALSLEHVTQGRFYSVSIVFFTQALFDNVAVWLCGAMALPISGGDRHFLASPFTEALTRKRAVAAEELSKHDAFVKYVNKYRQVWVHTISGGAIAISDRNPFQYPDSARKFLGVPRDPAIQPDQDSYMKRVEKCAKQNNGEYLNEIGDFTGRVFEGAAAFYLGWLRFALDHVS